MNLKDLTSFLSAGTKSRREFLMEIVAVGGLALGAKLTKAEEPKPAKGDPKVYTVQVARADLPNGNRRIYPRKVLEESVRVFQANYKRNRGFMGQMGMPSDSIIHFKDVSHVVTDMRMDGDYLIADVEVVDTPCGQILDKLLDESREIVAFRTAGVGNGEVNGDGFYVVGDSYKMISINAVPAKEAATI